ncbi:MAG: SDR family oxidoreductase [Gemmatimonadales bacterium]
MAPPLAGQVALVAGATRGAGRGIARMLGEAGATVWCTGRSTRERGATPGRPETIEETAELVTAAGGRGIAVRVDHTVRAEVEALVARIGAESGRLDVLVNDIWGGDELSEWGKPFWEQSPEKGFLMYERAVHTHILTAQAAVPLMLPRKAGLIVEVTDGDFHGYHLNFFYDLAKNATARLGYAMACDLRGTGITALAVTPGFLRSEAMLQRFGVTEENWRDGAGRDPHFIASETPCFVGRAVAALAADPNVAAKAGGVYGSWTLAREYNFRDIDRRRPDWGEYFTKTVAEILDRGGPADEGERFLLLARYYQTHREPAPSAEAARIAKVLNLPPAP